MGNKTNDVFESMSNKQRRNRIQELIRNRASCTDCRINIKNQTRRSGSQLQYFIRMQRYFLFVFCRDCPCQYGQNDSIRSSLFYHFQIPHFSWDTIEAQCFCIYFDYYVQETNYCCWSIVEIIIIIGSSFQNSIYFNLSEI